MQFSNFIKRSTFKRKEKDKRKKRKLILHSYYIKEKASRIFLFTHFFALCVTKLGEVIYRGRFPIPCRLFFIKKVPCQLFFIKKTFFIKKVITDMTLTVTLFLKNIILIKKWWVGDGKLSTTNHFFQIRQRNDYRNCKGRISTQYSPTACTNFFRSTSAQFIKILYL
jgi:hypothetical protein